MEKFEKPKRTETFEPDDLGTVVTLRQALLVEYCDTQPDLYEGESLADKKKRLSDQWNWTLGKTFQEVCQELKVQNKLDANSLDIIRERLSQASNQEEVS
jgi:hypothetical protein